MEKTITSFQNLTVYQKSEQLTLEIYKLCQELPKEELYGLSSQIKRASLSIGANIAESYGRFHIKDKVNFLYHSRGSLYEVEHFIRIALKLNFINKKQIVNILPLIQDTKKLLNGYIRSFKRF